MTQRPPAERPLPVAALRLAGVSGAGKTTLGTRLVEELSRRGHRVAAVKHAQRHDAPGEPEGKDTARYRAAGAVAGAFRGEALVRLPAAPLETLLELLAPLADLVIVEGYHDVPLPAVEVLGPGDEPRPSAGCETLAVVVRVRDGETPPPGRHTPEDVAAIADIVERRLL